MHRFIGGYHCIHFVCIIPDCACPFSPENAPIAQFSLIIIILFLCIYLAVMVVIKHEMNLNKSRKWEK